MDLASFVRRVSGVELAVKVLERWRSTVPSTYAPISHTHPTSEITGLGSLATVTPTGTPTGAKFMRDDYVWTAPTASVAISSVSIPFTNGDTVQRVTVTDATVGPDSKVMGAVLRPDTDDSADKGFIFVPNVVKRNTGSFELVVACLDQGGLDPTENPPNETVQYLYLVS